MINSLAKQSGYDFLYSKNIVDVSKLVSINIKNRPINEALTMIERQVNVSFRMHDRHIVIKSNPKPVTIIQQPEKQVANIETKPVLESADNLLLTSNPTTIPEKVFESQATPTGKQAQQKDHRAAAIVGSERSSQHS
ncbi:MAG: STN domain-containing protein [Bacteroidota bacterium]